MRHWRTTKNSNVAIHTGNTYISVRASSQKVSTSDCNIERQPEIWPPKPESYTTGTATHSVEIPMVSPTFLTVASPNKVSPSDCDNDRQLKMAMWPPKPEIVISLELQPIGWQFQRQIWGFRSRPARRNWPRAIATTNDNRKWKYRRFGRQSCNFCWSIVVTIIWLILYRTRHYGKSRIWRWTFDATCHSSRDVILPVFADTSICQVLRLPTLYAYEAQM